MKSIVHERIAEISAKDWDACAGTVNPFVSHAFLNALEESGSVGRDKGWVPHHLAFYADTGGLAAAAPLYLKFHSYGEYVFDQSWADAWEKAGGAYYPKLQICVPFSPVSGPRFLYHPDHPVPLDTLSDALKKICAEYQLSSAHMTFCTEDEWTKLGNAGWLQRLGMQFHWTNEGYKTFDDFLAALSSSHRKSIRRERRDANAAGLIFETLRGQDIKPSHWDSFYKFYTSTVDRKWGEAYLTRDFFAHLSDSMGNKVVLMMATKDGAPVAGALNLVGRDTLYGRNWGCIGQWPFLHFELCYYRAIDFAIELGLKRVEAGAQGEHKILRGYLPQLTYSAHYIAHTALARGVKDFLDHEREGVKRNIAGMNNYSPFREKG